MTESGRRRQSPSVEPTPGRPAPGGAELRSRVSHRLKALAVGVGGASIVLALWLQLGSCVHGGAQTPPTEPAAVETEPSVAPAAPPAAIPEPAPARGPGAQNARSAVGYNLDFPGDWTGSPPFIDLMKNARAWMGACPDSDSKCDGVSELDLDPHGWLKSLHYKHHPEKSYAYVEAVVLTRNSQPGFEGELWVEYEGTGQIELQGAEVTSRDPAHRRIAFHAARGSVFLRLVATDPGGKGDYLRNIRVFRADQAEALRRGQVFNPDLLEYLAPFGSLRFMDWMESNQRGVCSGGPQRGEECYAHTDSCGGGRCIMAGVWSERPRADQVSYLSRSQFLDPEAPGRGVRVGGYPVEVMVALANAAGADPHFNLPAAYEDEYVREFARYVKEHLAHNLRPTVEYSNETWNWGFPQANYVNAKGRKLWPDEGSAWVQYAGSRMQHLCQLWKGVFGKEKARVRCLMSPQTGWMEMARAMLDCPAWAAQHPDAGPCYQGTDAVAISGYFSGCLQQRQNEPKLRAWLAKGPAFALDQVFRQLEQGGLVQCKDDGVKASLADTIEQYQAYARLAQARGLELYVYESGTHFDYEGKDAAIERLLLAATRDERMGQLYRRNLEAFKEAGGTIFNAWGWVGPHDLWANADQLTDRTHPKYRALRDFALNTPCWWEHCDRSQR